MKVKRSAQRRNAMDGSPNGERGSEGVKTRRGGPLEFDAATVGGWTLIVIMMRRRGEWGGTYCSGGNL